MFFSQLFLSKKGVLGPIWIAAHLERRLRKSQINDLNIPQTVGELLQSRYATARMRSDVLSLKLSNSHGHDFPFGQLFRVFFPCLSSPPTPPHSPSLSPADTILNPEVPIALRLSGHLLLGVVRIYNRKVKGGRGGQADTRLM